ncbi:MAG: efflux RND transporter permease subunit [bacterium]
MQWLVVTSLRLRVAITVLTVILMIAGTRIISTTAFDVFPEFAPPLVEIQTEAPGLSTSEVEALVTVPIENALNGTSWLKKVRSKSVLGLSSVVLYFEEGADLLKARQLVQERLAQLTANLPAVAKPPVILSPLSSMSRLMKIGISSKKLSQMEMTTIAKWTIRPRLMAIPGVANVAIWGQRDRQIQVLLDPQRLRAHEVTAGDVLRATQEATEIGGGGFVDMPNQRLAVSHVSPVHQPQDLAHVPVAVRNGTPLLLGQVAELVEGFPPPIGDAVINDAPGLLLIVEKQPWGNTLEVTHKVEAALAALRPGLADLEIDPTIFRPATFIEMSLENLNRAMLMGCVLVILVLVFFLNDWRTALISVLAIPTSLLAAALVLHYRGGTINTMVLAGLVIALGEVVDDAIIDVENIMRRLRLNREAGEPQSAFQVVLKASLEVRSAVVYGSVIVALVLLPVFLLEGLSGSFFRPLAVSYVLAILASLFVALTLTPALSLLLLPQAARRRQEEAPLVRRLKLHYESVLPKLIARPRRVIAVLAGSILAALLALPFLGEEFLPHFKEYDFLMHWVEKPGTSLEAMRRITVRASQELRAIPGVRNFGSHLGRAEVADEVVGPNFTELWISLDPQVDYEPTVAKIQKVVDGYPGLYRDLLTYLRERIKEVLTGASATLVVRIYGEDLGVLHQQAEEVRAAIAGVPGVVDLKVQPQILVPQVEVRLRPEAAAQFGLTPGEVRRAATLLVKGVKAGEFYEAQKVFDVVVWGAPHVRDNVEAIRDLRIATPAVGPKGPPLSGGMVPLRDVADIVITPTPNQITREAASRYTEVTCNVRGRDLGSVASDIEKKVESVHFERGYHPEFLGEYAAQQASKNRILMLSLLAVIGILLILHADFASLRLALFVLLSLPFALVGGVLGVICTGGVLSLGSLVGFVTVLGIAARNGIMLISHYRHLESEEDQAFGIELILRGAQERLAPILMTALAAALALLPIVLGGNRPGHEIEHPMAVVILGGLVSSTGLNLFVVPVLYLKFGRKNLRS